MKIILVINPISGDKNKTVFIDFAKGFMDNSKIDFELYKTTGHRDCEKLNQLIVKHTPDKVIIVGGDGTLNLFLKPLVEHKTKVGFIPMGSANGLAAEFNLTKTARILFKKYVQSHETKALDVLSINDEHLFLHLGDIGANANLVANYDKDEERGMFTYAKHFWSEFQNLKSFEIDIKTDRMQYERKGVMLAICNGKKFGTGIPLNTIGKMDDGIFELVVVKAMDFTDLIKATLSKFDEDHKVKNLETFQAKTATIKLKQPQLLQIDGEVVKEFTKLEVKVLDEALSFIKHQT
ncbi:diacylglycerol/lipid kinase family protein [Flavobacteriaceae bacterium 14752]|uniref:diacylglycerol/lipid kinase family protein n=1 Tax=Mesohalobacter salilacus TaxID=2491711 RepID=UPI000F638D7A|nr:lipid kinase [Flavobacteriaceae bacterium 14752]